MNNTLSTRYSIFVVILVMTVVLLDEPLKGKLRFTYDSRDYISASQSSKHYFDTYLRGTNPDGFPYFVRTPLLSLYLSLFDDKLRAAAWLNVASFVASLFLVWRIAELLGLPGFFAFGTVVITGMSYPWLQNHFFLWSEPVFCAFLLLLVIALIERWPVVWIIVLCLLLFFLRKAGIFLAIAAAGFFLLRREYRALTFLSIAMVAVVGLWELITLQLAQNSISLDNFNYLSRLDRDDFADAVTAWWLPRVLPLWLRLVTITLSAIGLVVFSKIFFKRLVERRAIQILGLLSFGYLFLMIVVIGSPEYAEAERYTSVVLPLFLLLLAALSYEFMREYPKTRKITAFALLAWAVYPVIRTFSHIL